MAEHPAQTNPDGGKTDTTDYSASKAPETRPAVESQQPSSDARLTPGGEHGSSAPIGMPAMDRDEVPSGAVGGEPADADEGPDGVK